MRFGGKTESHDSTEYAKKPKEMTGWHGSDALRAEGLSSPILKLVTYKNSITQLVEQLINAPTNISVLYQGSARPPDYESDFISTHLGSKQLVCREICMTCMSTPILVARTIWSREDSALDQAMEQLGTKPLATLLFREPSRAELRLREAKVLSENDPLYRFTRKATANFGSNPKLVARRSLYWLAQQPLLLTEVFLPAAQQLMGTKAARE